MLKDPPYNDGRHLSPEKQGLGASPSHRHKKETEHRFSDFAAFPSGHQGVCLGQWVSDFSVSPLSIMRTLKSDFFPHASYFYWHCVRNESWEHLKIFHFEILMNWFHVITYNIFMKTIFQKKKKISKSGTGLHFWFFHSWLNRRQVDSCSCFCLQSVSIQGCGWRAGRKIHLGPLPLWILSFDATTELLTRGSSQTTVSKWTLKPSESTVCTVPLKSIRLACTLDFYPGIIL